TEAWEPYDQAWIDAYGPTEIQRHALTALADRLHALGGRADIYVYPLFEAGLYDVWNDDYVPYPFFYSLGNDTADNLIIVAFDPKERQYFVLQCVHMVQTQLLFNASYLNTFAEDNYFTDLLAIRSVLFRVDSLEVLVRACAALLR
ncbi:MAG: hypothetical protein AAFZ52_19560, partial [Bacteroidota bacterium]